MNTSKVIALVQKYRKGSNADEILSCLTEYVEILREESNDSIVTPDSTSWTTSTTSLDIPLTVMKVHAVFCDGLPVTMNMTFEEVISQAASGSRCYVSNDGKIYFSFALADDSAKRVIKLKCTMYDSSKYDTETMGDQYILPSAYFILHRLFVMDGASGLAEYWGSQYEKASTRVYNLKPASYERGY